MAETPEQYKTLIDTLKEFDIVPKADTKEELELWMKAYVEEHGLMEAVKLEPTHPEKSTVSGHHETKSQPAAYIHPPRLSIFSGTSGKGETSFDLWFYEVRCLLQEKTHAKELVAQAIRRSLKGEAGRVIMGLGPHADVTDILRKLTSVYGEVDDRETIMSEFYGSRQSKDENVTAWSCRLECIIGRALTTGTVSKPEADKMLHDMLWKGLKPELKAITHYEREKFNTFDELRVALRRIEKENKLDEDISKKQISKQAVVVETEQKEDFAGILKQITHRLDNIERGRSRYRTQKKGYQSKGRYRESGSDGYHSHGKYDNNREQTPDYPPIKCRRCRKEGHIEKGCRERTDVDGKPLNYSKSTFRGRP